MEIILFLNQLCKGRREDTIVFHCRKNFSHSYFFSPIEVLLIKHFLQQNVKDIVYNLKWTKAQSSVNSFQIQFYVLKWLEDIYI